MYICMYVFTCRCGLETMSIFSAVLIIIIAIPFLLFFVRIIIICWKNYALAHQLKILEQLQQATRQQAEAPYTASCSSNNNDNNNTEPKDFDLPPTYDEVVQSYMMAKQEQQQSQENIVNVDASNGIIANQSSNTLSTAVSTLTIETEVSNSLNVSVVNLNNASTSRIPNTMVSQEPPSYDHINVSPAKTNNNDHIV